MPIALATSADGHLGHGRVVVAEVLDLLLNLAARVSSRVAAVVVMSQACRAVSMATATAAAAGELDWRDEASEHDLDVRGSDPVLDDRARVGLVKGGPTFQSAEADAVRVEQRRLEMLIGANGLLLVGLRDLGPERSVEDLLALARVVLERDPRLAKVRALHDGHRVGLVARAELQADVRELVLFAERNLNGQIGRLRGIVDGRRDPAGRVGRLQVGQVGDARRIGGVALVADARVPGRRRLERTLGGRAELLNAVLHGRRAASARRHDRLVERDVLELGYAALRDAGARVVAGIVDRRRRQRLTRRRLGATALSIVRVVRLRATRCVQAEQKENGHAE